jgi:DNA-binding SARP family transcriptional activator
MDIKLLGPLEVTVNGTVITPTAAKPRQLLAILAMNAGRVTPLSVLVEELWGDQPIRSAANTMHTYIMQLRKCIIRARPSGLEASAKDILATHYSGYVLKVPAESVDVHRYQQLVDAGNRAIRSEEYETGASLMRSALDIWRGAALVDVQHGSRLQIQVTRLEESRITAMENRLEAELRLGHHQSLLSELAMLSAQHPLHENLCAMYMIALHRGGRRWQALQAFSNLRQTLVDELGVEPSGRLQSLQMAILSAAPQLEGEHEPQRLARVAS